MKKNNDLIDRVECLYQVYKPNHQLRALDSDFKRCYDCDLEYKDRAICSQYFPVKSFTFKIVRGND